MYRPTRDHFCHIHGFLWKGSSIIHNQSQCCHRYAHASASSTHRGVLFRGSARPCDACRRSIVVWWRGVEIAAACVQTHLFTPAVPSRPCEHIARLKRTDLLSLVIRLSNEVPGVTEKVVELLSSGKTECGASELDGDPEL
eukprot:1925449-Rhodomonas_salina.1